ncbi:diaminohydroxyphosphoribosylaminopyrimidine deaminase / 5-amino-6-(5-phosphoribosylamino)uracil reductase [Evansella caseinilytica]|uniref:Riboflavin biosynthesis protein RibD n=1 Tax=Evansella caseinilytica TaxID=1503961 RepID=A0A1H3L8D1_9BACI|nr:bifunctional diaminohydroxyphosphoribosylaminopyrimidine deaminase/5-amino-6-(5-phosphoribosylamino)uracil reductase RibD [Evansella caseinilytica]SDY60135.1 diaminohydroxyphosphoribosylaminopyrimidine deaminase / 5-amino-6-(5-phosphoribosylamino)uracil reductase [Evansella caseinilytica]
MHEHYMELAMKLASSARGQTSPNPLVGAVIVKNNEIVGMGAHLKAGEWHAERHALQMAGEKAKDAVMYVTLEPCSHYGRTPPCADAVIAAGIKEVYVAMADPNPKVAGAGISKLRNAGISVHVGLLQEKAAALNEIFFYHLQSQKPYVTLKSATSLDGKIATYRGESQWITGEAARLDAHKLRHEHDGILVGINTVLADDPALTTRLAGGGRHPIRIILDRQLRTPLQTKVVADNAASTWIVTLASAAEEKKQALRKAGVKVIEFTDKIDISRLLTFLGENGISSLLVEGGGTINDAFLRAGEFQQVIVYLAPKIIGGEKAPGSFGGAGIAGLAEAPGLVLESMETLDDDVKLVYKKGVDESCLPELLKKKGRLCK